MNALLSNLRKWSAYRVYTKEYLKLAGKSYRDIDSWILPMAAAKLIEKIPGEEKWLLGIINEKLKGYRKTIK
jgi:hypothetical protein